MHGPINIRAKYMFIHNYWLLENIPVFKQDAFSLHMSLIFQSKKNFISLLPILITKKRRFHTWFCGLFVDIWHTVIVASSWLFVLLYQWCTVTDIKLVHCLREASEVNTNTTTPFGPVQTSRSKQLAPSTMDKRVQSGWGVALTTQSLFSIAVKNDYRYALHLHPFCVFMACYVETFTLTPTHPRIFISFRFFCRNCAFWTQSGNTPVVLSCTPCQAEPFAVAFRTEAPADSNIFRMRSLQQNELPLWST